MHFLLERTIPSKPVDTAVQSGTDERHPFLFRGFNCNSGGEYTRVNPSHLSRVQVLHNMLYERHFNSKKDQGLFDGNPAHIRDVIKFEFESILRICEAKKQVIFTMSPLSLLIPI
ncbi:hypothetical protein FRC03_004992 [Tulasnella sp. 419]|nr:hypothetical protein FRC03_004992 [Tulasnella sp. 419]